MLGRTSQEVRPGGFFGTDSIFNIAVMLFFFQGSNAKREEEKKDTRRDIYLSAVTSDRKEV